MILSTFIDSPYARLDGTSMACAHITGVAALLWSFKPSATVEEIKNTMFTTALDLGSPGKDIYFGHGLVQAMDALEILNGGPLEVKAPTFPPFTASTPAPIPPGTLAPIVSATSNAVQWRLDSTIVKPQEFGPANIGDCGHGIAMSGDGMIIAVACPNASFENVPRIGRVRVYQKANPQDEEDWIQMGQTLAGESMDELAGFSIAIGADGRTLAVGMPGYDASIGRVQIYRFESVLNSWIQIGNDIQGESEGEECGKSVAMSLDSTSLAVGCPSSDGVAGIQAGVVNIYRMDMGNEWGYIGTIEGEESRSQAGVKVAIDSTGEVVAVVSERYQAPSIDGTGRKGYLGVYRRTSDSDWTRIGETIEGQNVQFDSPCGVAMSEDGTVVVFGNSSADNGPGNVRIYQLHNEYVEIASITVPETADNFGEWLDLSADGTVIAIAGPSSRSSEASPFAVTGLVQVYRRQSDNDSWEQVGEDIIGNDHLDYEYWGVAVKVSRGGNRIAASVALSEGLASDGNVRLFELTRAATR